jgi:hypothetical protein
MMVEYKLKTPVKIGEEVTEVVKLEEPTVERLKQYNVDLSQEALELCEGMFRIVCACAVNIAEAEVNRMKMRDLVGCTKECVSFFKDGEEKSPE